MTTGLSKWERRQGQGEAASLDTWLSFNDLRRAGIVDSWQTLRAWQKDPRVAFPPGRLLGPNSRRWSKRTEIDPWLASRPTGRDDAA
jgi:predicted DNA-binding transcriptional regulator AlpA